MSMAERVIQACRAKGLMLSMAESCTGGMLAAALTDVPGASAVVERGFVTYTNEICIIWIFQNTSCLVKDWSSF